MPPEIRAADLADARLTLGRQRPDLALRSEHEAVQFIDSIGLVLLFRSPTLDLPNLADACVGGRWEWGSDPTALSAWELKETLPAGGHAFYAKLLGGRGTFVAWRLVPALVASWRRERRLAALTNLEQMVLSVVTIAGPILTRDLRRHVQAMAPCEAREVREAIDRLQDRLLITVAGGSIEGWSMHTWDLVERRLPPHASREVSSSVAQQLLAQAYLDGALVAKPSAIARLFGWTVGETRTALAVDGGGSPLPEVGIDDRPGRWIASPRLRAYGIRVD